MVADTGEGLWEMFQELEKYSEKSRLRVNTQKTKENEEQGDEGDDYDLGGVEGGGAGKFKEEAVPNGGSNHSGCNIWGEDLGMGEVNANTSEYIWGIEAGKGSLELESKKRAEDYLMEILRMGDERWPKVCLKEEIRGIVNGYQSAWGQKLKKAFEEGVQGVEVRFGVRGLVEEQVEREIKGAVGEVEMREYMKNEGERVHKHGVQAMRRRGRNIGAHMGVQEGERGNRGRWVEEIEGLGLLETEEGIRVKLVGLLKGELNVGMCEYNREFKRRARENKKGERRLDLWGDW
ncbi:hypothetical protein M0802_012033 [Mischocyttarus mexicanus]|nr:hypothetical protein M0802_012033 [Mischocyttarus mexicanus]